MNAPLLESLEEAIFQISLREKYTNPEISRRIYIIKRFCELVRSEWNRKKEE